MLLKITECVRIKLFSFFLFSCTQKGRHVSRARAMWLPAAQHGAAHGIQRPGLRPPDRPAC